MQLHSDSHLDHGLTPAMVVHLLELFAECAGFFIETVELPAELGEVPLALLGPIVGDDPVLETEVEYYVRVPRQYPSRVVRSRSPRTTRTVTVIMGPHADLPCVLYTAFGGPLTPKELGDPTLLEPDRHEAETFWKVHALAVT